MCLSAFNVFLYALFRHFFCSGLIFSHFKLTYFLPIMLESLSPVFKTYNLIPSVLVLMSLA